MLKDEYPKAISDLLGIPTQYGIAGPWMSNQGTVIQPWLEAVAEALNVPYTGRKTTMMRALVEAVGGTWNPSTMASTQTPSGGGGNVSKPAFEELLSGLRRQVVTNPVREINEESGPFEPTAAPDRSDDLKMLRAIRVRRGQPKFRADLLAAYGGRCAVTGCDVAEALEAAHITPYGDGGTYEVSNGLLLRADLHTLLDSKRVSFDAGRRLLVHPSMMRSEYGAALDGLPLSEPLLPGLRVPDEVLAAHRSSCEF